ncbi:MAG: DUF3084 domain-containing protein [Gloeomargarita sp. SKYBB_i_bin120]|nr:DUF3084 domain-containing protein [Gloeomargarita sp. SKYB120]MDW8179234.1 DUF3084 domain-containing protein [Gloeomargarita sp. SKYBB_i_bin120]
MVAGYTLILVILVLGGLIAALGDRIGTRVGKARLSLFKLRPRTTAVLVTIATGGVISATTLGILLAADQQLRDGLFRLDQIQADLKRVRKQKDEAQAELEAARQQLARTQAELQAADRNVKAIEAKLVEVNRNYQQALAKLASAEQESRALEAQIAELKKDRAQLQAQLQQAQTQVAQARAQAERLRRQGQQLQAQIAQLEQVRGRLEQEIGQLRQGNVVIRREQVLATATVRAINDRDLARQAVQQTLQEASRVAGCLSRRQGPLETCLHSPQAGNPYAPRIRISSAEFNNLVNTLSTGRDYVVRVLAAANYSSGEPEVEVFTDVTPNRLIFPAGAVVAQIPIDLDNSDEVAIFNQLDRLFLASNVRARQSGILADPLTNKVGSFSQVALVQFVEQLQNLKGVVYVQSVTRRPIYTAGPLDIQLVAVQNGQIILRSS